ncbi:MAG: AbiV family abortive infection protein [Coriobacteriia bacterium]|nr:AbiV family abortive infection protein [Coriobacteriia bacterium]
MGERQPYRGWLSAEQIAEGKNACSRNARRLYDDASMLYEQNRFASAAALAILAIEETYKLTLLDQLTLCSTDEQTSKCWKEFSSHAAKGRPWDFAASLPGELEEDELPSAEYFWSAEIGCSASTDANRMKQAAIYVDCVGEGNWVEPADEFREQTAHEVLDFACSCSSRADFSVREIELMREHLKPLVTRGTVPSGVVSAIRSYLDAASEEKVLPPAAAERWARVLAMLEAD